MNDRTSFIDFERFVEWLYNNSHLIGEEYFKNFKKSTVQNWKKYLKIPNDQTLQDINNLITSEEEKFSKIDGLDLLLCVNNAKDHNRGKNRTLLSVSSTGKKVLMLLILGRLIDDNNKHVFLTASKKKNFDVWTYLSRFNTSSTPTKVFYYYPGRTVSVEQLCAIGKGYLNRINDRAIPDGLKELEKKGLVEHIKDNLYKLDFNGCKSFLIANKS